MSFDEEIHGFVCMEKPHLSSMTTASRQHNHLSLPMILRCKMITASVMIATITRTIDMTEGQCVDPRLGRGSSLFGRALDRMWGVRD